jgi:uncharacterized membrane protein YbaN (DUF454 family)
MALVKNRALRLCIFALGIVAVILGIIGAFLPLLPTTPFILLAAWCFLKSSARAHSWLYHHPIFGKALRDWQENRSIARSNKFIAVSMIALSLVFIWVKVSHPLVKYSVTVLLVSVSVFISTRNEKT